MRLVTMLATLAFVLCAPLAPAMGQGDALDRNNPEHGVHVRAMNEFALNLYQELRRENGNLFLSPWSVHTAMTMVMAGARGQTEAAMRRTLALPDTAPLLAAHQAAAGLSASLVGDMDHAGYELAVANRIWARQGLTLDTSFLDLLDTAYGAGVETLDFARATEEARRIINQWVADQTHDRIQDLIPQGLLSPDTSLVLTNAVYFLGTWEMVFDPALTSDAHFYLDQGGEAMARIMYQSDRFGYAEQDGVKVLELPYAGNKLSMVVVLPEPGGLEDLEEDLDLERLEMLISGLSRQEVRVWLPKWEYTSQFLLSGPLSDMGMDAAFGPEADFTGMDPAGTFALSEVVHKAFVAVDEQGTEAAAATGGLMVLAMQDPSEPKEFRADHPFLYFIRDLDSGAILFMGRVADPTN